MGCSYTWIFQSKVHEIQTLKINGGRRKSETVVNKVMQNLNISGNIVLYTEN